MATYVVRVWLPDRPGALGAVASRIGAVRGDLVGIDILERGGGRVIDELAVELPEDALLPLLVQEMSEVDGVDVEDVRPLVDALIDPRLDALETAAALVEHEDAGALVAGLATHVGHALEAEWVVVLDDAGRVAASSGTGAPAAGWLSAFVSGASTSAAVLAGEGGPDDIACAVLGTSGLVLVLGRRGRPFRARERRQLGALARIADRRWVEVNRWSARSSHPASRGMVHTQ